MTGGLPPATAVVTEPPRAAAAATMPARSGHSDEISVAAFLNSGTKLRFDVVAEPRVSVLLVLFNRAELTLRCLLSLHEISPTPFEVICVDNNSSDETS